MSKKVIIIGSGIGGLSTAIRLLHNGYKVIIYEKNKNIGGRVNLIETKNFKFDLSASILMMPDVYKELFSYINKNYEDYLEFIELDPIYRVFSYDNSIINFNNNLFSLTNSLEKISHEDSSGYYKFISETYEKYLITNKYFLQKSQDEFKNFLSLKSMINVFKINPLTTSYNYVSKYVKNEKLREYLSFQSMYIGISPFSGPNIYNLIPLVCQLYGLWHLKGGMYSFVNALSKLIFELGGTIKTETIVSEILFSKGKAIGLKTNNGIEKADIIISNVDFPYTMKHLIKDMYYKDGYNNKKLSKMKYSCSTFIIYLGLKKSYPNLSVHNIYLGKNFKENIESAFKGKLPLNPSLYIYCPTRVDRSYINSDGECLNITLRVPNLFFKNISWNEDTKDMLTNIILNEIKNIKGLENMEKDILYKNCFTPVDMESYFNSYGGTAFGLSPTLTQTNYFRPHFKSKRAKNLFFVGSSMHPGPGVSLVLNSSKLVTEEILNSMKNL